jgi:ABC-type transport system substrate-binding protein
MWRVPAGLAMPALRAAGALTLMGAAACSPGERPPAPAADLDHPTFSGGPPGGVVVVLMDGEPDDLNPITYTSNPAYQAVRLMFRGLARRDSTLSGY